MLARSAKGAAPRRADHAAMERLTAGLPTKAAKIRELGAGGFTRQAIADFLGISYQHVRNVLTQPARGAVGYRQPPAAARTGLAESPSAPHAPPATEFVAEIGIARFNIDPEGRITLTPELLDALETRPGGLITARLENGELVVMGIDAALRFARREIPPWKPGEPRWSDRLIAERRAEAAGETGKHRRWPKKSS